MDATGVTLYPAMKLRTPCGNTIVLIFCEDGEWTCRFTADSSRMGEIAFTDAWLRRFCTVC